MHVVVVGGIILIRDIKILFYLVGQGLGKARFTINTLEKRSSIEIEVTFCKLSKEIAQCNCNLSFVILS
jgi:hypothetical protein